jgi:hypothetical protein
MRIGIEVFPNFTVLYFLKIKLYSDFGAIKTVL